MPKDSIKKEFESVKLSKDLVNKVRDNKVKTGVPIAVFIESAVDDKLSLVKTK